jgi:hypothetical protein
MKLDARCSMLDFSFWVYYAGSIGVLEYWSNGLDLL